MEVEGWQVDVIMLLIVLGGIHVIKAEESFDERQKGNKSASNWKIRFIVFQREKEHTPAHTQNTLSVNCSFREITFQTLLSEIEK